MVSWTGSLNKKRIYVKIKEISINYGLLLIIMYQCWFTLCNKGTTPRLHGCAKLTQLCSTLCDPMDSSPPSSSVHRNQARILEWVAMASSRGSSWPKDWTCVTCTSCITGRFFTIEPPGKPIPRLDINYNRKWVREYLETHCSKSTIL